jgi:TetR/AcrR family transcriptional regulator, transcriptional repressor for nem operon
MLLEEERRMSKGELTRQAIIEKAAPLFNQRGFAGCSMADIMEATGLEKGGLYRHFSSKEELAADVFRYAMQTAVDARGISANLEGDAVTQLRLMIARFVAVPSPLPGGCPLLNTAIDSDDGNLVLRELAQQALASWKQKIRRIVKKGISAGELGSSADPHRIANLVVATLEGSLMITRLEGNRRALQDAQLSLEAFLDAIQSRKTTAQRPNARRSSIVE